MSLVRFYLFFLFSINLIVMETMVIVANGGEVLVFGTRDLTIDRMRLDC